MICDIHIYIYTFPSQGFISRTKDFGEAYELVRAKMTELHDQLVSCDGLQPDILTKKSQLDQFRVRLGKIVSRNGT